VEVAGGHAGRLGDQVRRGATCDLRGIPLLHLLDQLHWHSALPCNCAKHCVRPKTHLVEESQTVLAAHGLFIIMC